MIRDNDWYAARAKGIGGSDAAAVLGISPFKSPLRLHMEKRHEIKPDDLEVKEHIYWGTVLESFIADEYQRRTGKEVISSDRIAVHKDYPWMLCNVDRYVRRRSVDPRVILEIKNVSLHHFAAGEWGDDHSSRVPPYYYAQAQHNIAVTDAAQCDMPVLIGGNEYRCYHLPRDNKFIELLISKEQVFWDGVQTGKRPDPINADDLKILFPEHTPGQHIEADEITATAWAKLAKIAISLANIKALKRDAEFLVKNAMGVAEHLSFNGVKLATWRTSPKDGRRRFRVITKGVEVADEVSEGDD
jgi:putative phage-type endonuclease